MMENEVLDNFQRKVRKARLDLYDAQFTFNAFEEAFKQACERYLYDKFGIFCRNWAAAQKIFYLKHTGYSGEYIFYDRPIKLDENFEPVIYFCKVKRNSKKKICVNLDTYKLKLEHFVEYFLLTNPDAFDEKNVLRTGR